MHTIRGRMPLKGGMARGLLALATLAGSVVVAAAPSRAQLQPHGFSEIVVNAGNGQVLASVDANAPRHPASLTKLMTLYMLFEALRDHRITLDDPMPVSAHAAAMEPTKLWLAPGTTLTVQQAILGMVTQSANDAAAVAGEYLGGSEPRFAQMMTLRAHALGMSNTWFRNASGLPDPDQWTTARDLATLAVHLIRDFPEDYHYFSTPSFLFRGRRIYNHDTELRAYPGADGLKTGYIDSSGFNLVTSAVRDNVRLVGVVLGADSGGERDAYMTAQLNQSYEDAGVPVMLARATPRPLTLIPRAEAAMYRSPVPLHRVLVRPVVVRHPWHPAPVRVAARPALAVVHPVTHRVAQTKWHPISRVAATSCVWRLGKRVCTPVKRVASR